MSRNPLTILLPSLLLAATQVFAASKTTNEFIKEFTTAIGNKDKTAFQQLWQLPSPPYTPEVRKQLVAEVDKQWKQFSTITPDALRNVGVSMLPESFLAEYVEGSSIVSYSVMPEGCLVFTGRKTAFGQAMQEAYYGRNSKGEYKLALKMHRKVAAYSGRNKPIVISIQSATQDYSGLRILVEYVASGQELKHALRTFFPDDATRDTHKPLAKQPNPALETAPYVEFSGTMTLMGQSIKRITIVSETTETNLSVEIKDDKGKSIYKSPTLKGAGVLTAPPAPTKAK